MQPLRVFERLKIAVRFTIHIEEDNGHAAP